VGSKDASGFIVNRLLAPYLIDYEYSEVSIQA
jgi:3-hydroxyacyl-CoA dehydrogenase